MNLTLVGSNLFYDIYANENESALEQYLDIQAEQNTTDFNPEVEEELNEAGLFDDEIKTIDKDIINDINNGKDFEVYNNYYLIIENTEDNKKNNDLDGTDKPIYNNDILDISELDLRTLDTEDLNIKNKFKAIELNDDVVDSIIETIYEDEIEESSLLSKINNIITHKVNAKNHVASDYNSKNGSKLNSGVIKMTVIITQHNKEKDVNISYTANWLTPPHHRLNDAFGVHLDNGTFIKNSVKTKYSCKEKCFNLKTKKTTYKNLSYNENGKLICKGSTVASIANLKDDTIKNNNALMYNNNIIIITITAKAHIKNTSKSIRYIIAYGMYYHQQYIKNLNISAGMSIDGSGSISFSPSVSKKMYPVRPNAQAELKFAR